MRPPRPAPQPSRERARPRVIEATAPRPVAPRRRTRFLRSRRVVAGVAVLAVVGTVIVVLYNRWQSEHADIAMLGDSELDTIMGVSGMRTVESGIHQAKVTSGVIEVTPPECASALYPGLDQTYREIGDRQVTWRVAEDRGGVGRAGVDANHFVDQDVAVFPARTGRALEFVRASAIPWKVCAGQTVRVVYRGTDTYTWKINDVSGDGPEIIQSFSLDGNDRYGCQRVLRTVSDLVVDVKACGDDIGDEASRIAGRLAASVTHTPPY